MISDHECYIVAEIGINHNGNLDTALKLIKTAYGCGADAVKFQKRTIDLVYTEEELAQQRESLFGNTNEDLKRGLEFGLEEYKAIDSLCKGIGIDWYASPWDTQSVKFLAGFGVPYLKLASASITDSALLKACCDTGIPLLVSTGMADLQTIRKVVDKITGYRGKIECLYHCNSTYPTKPQECNLLGITTLKKHFPGIRIGYSGHETMVPTGCMAAVLGAASVERHLTLDRSMFGSDQSASLEPHGFQKMCSEIRLWERVRGDGVIRFYESEYPVAKKLRRIDDV